MGLSVAIATISCVFYACDRNEPECAPANDGMQTLKLSENYDLSNLSKRDLGVLAQGIGRIASSGISTDHLLNEANAKEFNMSEELFNICASSFTSSNTKHYHIRLKANGEGEVNDCVAKSISYCIDQLRQGEPTSFYQVQFYCHKQYGSGGVSLNDIPSVLTQFTEYNIISSSELKFGDMIVTNNNNGDGHAAIFMKQEGNEIYFYNPRTPELPSSHCPISDLIEAFRITGFKNLK